MDSEQIEAMWEKLRELEQAIKKLEASNLEVAREAARFEVISAYNLIVVALPTEEIGPYAEYMKPRSELAEKAALGARGIKTAFQVADDFLKDCVNYFKSRKR